MDAGGKRTWQQAPGDTDRNDARPCLERVVMLKGAKVQLIGPASLEADAVVPQCLDNQYVSDAVFSKMMESDLDYRDQTIAELRERDFRTEFNRSLIYSSQVVIQRAFLKNSAFLYRNYLPEDGRNLEAFAQLMRHRAIVPYLFKESSLDESQEFDLSQEGDRAMHALLDEVGDDISCVRLAVDASDNAQATDVMTARFGTGLTSLQHLPDAQRNAMASELFADSSVLRDDGGWKAFDTALDGLALYAFHKAGELRANGKSLSRQNVYEDLLTTDVKDSVVRGSFKAPNSSNPFLFEIKKYVDLVYNCNLPDNLGRYTFTPANMPSRTALQDAPVAGYGHEQIRNVLSDADALESVRQVFMARAQKAMSLPLLRDLSMADALEVRGRPEWDSFRASQAAVLKNPLRSLELLEPFQRDFDAFQCALSDWYNGKYERERVEERYCSYVSCALSLGGALIIAGSHLGPREQVLSTLTISELVRRMPKTIKGYAAKLMVGVYDVGRRRLDADRAYTIELMKTNDSLARDDIRELLESITRKTGDGIPGVSGQAADQGIR